MKKMQKRRRKCTEEEEISISEERKEDDTKSNGYRQVVAQLYRSLKKVISSEAYSNPQ